LSYTRLRIPLNTIYGKPGFSERHRSVMERPVRKDTMNKRAKKLWTNTTA